ncbi:heterogeneous nuclear ribonucleoprotein [Striga asiatica]|uniref:Heterogeneous nuclear ribonucleoprotein n=1 Tax=Striga asiatica TaxID=4170 RepID=A0A5A7PHX9_STRAF|nr:heterogeneous nuclear ribonucleoprotein [Striga asiatica]
MSSIFKIMRTHSVDSVIALVLTSRGCTTFSSRIFVICPFLTNDSNWVQPSILGQRVRNNLKGLCKSPHAVAFHPLQHLRPGAQLPRELDLGGPTTCNQKLLVHQAPHHTQCIVQAPLSLIKHQMV